MICRAANQFGKHMKRIRALTKKYNPGLLNTVCRCKPLYEGEHECNAFINSVNKKHIEAMKRAFELRNRWFSLNQIQHKSYIIKNHALYTT